MSLRRALHEQFPAARQIVSPHGHAAEARNRLGDEAFNSLYRFAFVRNPWDRLVSWYSMLREKDGPRRGTKQGWDWYRFQAARSSFNEFLHRTASFHFKGAVFSFATNQIEYLTDPATGEMLVNDVLRFEDFAGGIETISKRLGVTLTLPHRNSSNHDNYRAYYTDETRDMIAQRFARDIAAFGYTF